MRKYIVALTLFCLLAWLSGPVSAQTFDGLTLTAEPAFGGQFKYGHWLPIFVTVENNGADLDAELRARITGQSGQLNFVVPAELPAGSRKRFTLYTLPNNFSRTVKVDLVRDEESVASQTVNIASAPNNRYFIGVVAENAPNLSLLSSMDLPGRADSPQVLNISLAETPDRAEGLTLFDTLILNAVDTSQLSPDQQTALQQWVIGGGRLVLGGGGGAALTLAGLPADLQPVTVTGQQELSALPALETYTGRTIAVSGPFLAAAVEPGADATILLSETNTSTEELPLIVERKLGQGYVDFVALDLTQTPFSDWAGVTDFAERLLAPNAAWPDFLPADIAPNQMRDSQMSSVLSNLPSLNLPSIRVLGLLLIGYIVLVGPLNYLILRRLDRLAWAWITIPALTLAFSALAFGLSYQLRGSDILLNQLSIMEISEDGRVTDTQTYVGIFSPHRQAYDVTVEGRPLLRPLGEGYYDPWSGEVRVGTMSVVQSEPAQVRGLTVNQWSIQSFVAETPLPEPPRLEAEISVERERLTGRLINQGTMTLEDVVVIFNTDFRKLGDIAPGQAVALNLDFSQQQLINTGGFGSYMIFQDELNQAGVENPELTFKQRVLDSTVFNQPFRTNGAGIFVLGWLKDSPLTVTLDGREVSSQKTSLLYGQLPVKFDEDKVSLPPSFSRAQTVTTTGQTGTCNYGTGIEGYYVERGSAEVKLSLPDNIRRIDPVRLDLYLQSDGGQWAELPQVDLYDRTTTEWIALEQVQFGQNSISQPERFFDPNEASLLLRLSRDANSQNGGCVFVGLAFEGARS